jgi:hypothetical protein
VIGTLVRLTKVWLLMPRGAGREIARRRGAARWRAICRGKESL